MFVRIFSNFDLKFGREVDLDEMNNVIKDNSSLKRFEKKFSAVPPPNICLQNDTIPIQTVSLGLNLNLTSALCRAKLRPVSVRLECEKVFPSR